MKSFRPAYRSKSAEESNQRRQQGNEVFKAKDYYKALVFYNQSVIYAPYSKYCENRICLISSTSANSIFDLIQINIGSLLEKSTLSLALANRSAVLVHLKEYNLAVRDIQLALQSNYPDNQRYKLYDRLGYCHQQLGDPIKARVAYSVALDCLEQSDLTPDAVENWRRTLDKSLAKLPASNKTATSNGVETIKPPQLLGGASLEFPNASRTLSMESDENSGRYYVAAEDIKPGQTLVYEKPYAACLLPEKFTSHCHHCFAR